MPKVAFYTLGCKVNQYESEAMVGLFRQAGYEIVPFEEDADVYVINTCTVTNISDRKSRQMIRRAVRQNPNAIVAVTGCYTQRAADEVLSIEGVDLIIGTDERHNIVELVQKAHGADGPINAVKDIRNVKSFEEMPIESYEGKARAFVKIEDGCDRYCTYCIIPYARGPVRSRAPQDIIDEVSRLSRSGFKEIVLTGIHVASYGKDIGGIALIDIIERVHGIEGIERIRLSSVEPTTLDDGFITRVKKLPKVCPHFHISLQSGCDAVLRRMGRRYTTAMYKDIVSRLREAVPDVAITTDIIVGFPGETDKEFEQTLAFVKEIAFSQVHVFPYSPRKGTPAAKFKDQVPPHIKEQRSHMMLRMAHELKMSFMRSHIGRTMPVLFEHEIEDGYYEGLTPNYIRVVMHSDTDISGRIINVQLNKAEDDYIEGGIEDGGLRILQDSVW
ncbi:tRNA (N(6)-L-threonylcarbamoyladenosine(37)-C(2))-methylthiotransferase MtaB [Mahella sp.]|uniref:tRNA (N(6)-L-threonylcarbamoyladenosine(37)-C(2))- methylthiotransferase MtaB n=1 Tax=Mahella sp. TaxID=2798721 RepID=UPI0025BAEB7A|nr:tRNA (N(6)-L-threonylcarbamoyladenosine(37)-C(2))-methylthiotransferase MtaB [Mahella sp.]MBZ4666054.1 modification enzyme MiaB family [Mahella sp.]MDK2902739.1 threonylcarbamoyladenosine tRNA methylthiotransferase MtaB [Clostridiales bacterium]